MASNNLCQQLTRRKQWCSIGLAVRRALQGLDLEFRWRRAHRHHAGRDRRTTRMDQRLVDLGGGELAHLVGGEGGRRLDVRVMHVERIGNAV